VRRLRRVPRMVQTGDQRPAILTKNGVRWYSQRRELGAAVNGAQRATILIASRRSRAQNRQHVSFWCVTSDNVLLNERNTQPDAPAR